MTIHKYTAAMLCAGLLFSAAGLTGCGDKAANQANGAAATSLTPAQMVPIVPEIGAVLISKQITEEGKPVHKMTRETSFRVRAIQVG